MNTIKCSKNCGLELYFSDAVLSPRGKKIPLEVEYAATDTKKEYPQFNGKHHNCPNSNYSQKADTNIKEPPKITKVNIKPFDNIDTTLLESENRYYYLAFIQAKERYPDLPLESDKFGTIVNAIANRLVKLGSQK